jgi:hypothetical protein
MMRGGKCRRITNAIRRLRVAPMPVRIKPMRTSLSARARRTNLSYFSYTTGIISINADKDMPTTAAKMAKPVRPAVFSQLRVKRKKNNIENTQGPTFHFA